MKNPFGQPGPLVTVLISTYNRPAYLAEALESIFAQTWPNFQIVLVRDGGCDVRRVTDRFNDPRLTFIDRDVNRGLPHSFNEALEKARGRYICYLGDDDRFFPHHIETLLTAMESQEECGVVYSDLYKTHCRVTADGRRVVLSRNVEISRDFERLLMLQFNHALHVSLMHRRDLLEKAGPYNESLNVLIDWDLTRRLCFYTDFLHVPIVTGEYYAPVGECDRISVQRRKNVGDYLRNLRTIRTTRPSKPWACVEDLSVVVLAPAADESLRRTLKNLSNHTFYPSEILIPMEAGQASGFVPETAHARIIPVGPEASEGRRIDEALRQSEGSLAAVLPVGIEAEAEETAWLERCVSGLLKSEKRNLCLELPESGPACWAGVTWKETLAQARQSYPDLPVREALRQSGVEVRKPRTKEHPFFFDFAIMDAEQFETQGRWDLAARMYEQLERLCGNTYWMQTRQAYALYRQGEYDQAGAMVRRLNRVRPTVSTWLLEARCCREMKQPQSAIECYRNARTILDGRGHPGEKDNLLCLAPL